MSKQIQISALMDGEVQTPEALDVLCHDQPMQKQWQRHHLIRDVIQGESTQFDIAARVAAALEHESVHRPQIKVIPLKRAQGVAEREASRLSGWWSSLAQVGVAACVSLAVVLGVQYSSNGDAPQLMQSAEPVLHTVPLLGSAEPVSLNLDAEQRSISSREAQLGDQQRRRINSLMQDHELQLRLYNTIPVMEQEFGTTAQ